MGRLEAVLLREGPETPLRPTGPIRVSYPWAACDVLGVRDGRAGSSAGLLAL